MITLNSNQMSNIAQNYLRTLDNSIADVTNSISTGRRVNSAKDNASVYSFCNKINFLNAAQQQAIQNAGDGISLAQTAEGGLTEISDNLLKIQELTMRSCNEIYTEAEVKDMQNEIGQRLDEIQRIADQSDFNGVKLFSSSEVINGEKVDKDLEIKLQIGTKDNQTISINIKNMGLKSLGLDNFSVVKLSAEDEKALKEAQTTYEAAKKKSDEAPNDQTLKTAADNAKKAVDELNKKGPGNNLKKIEDALSKINESCAGLGATQNRLSSIVNNLTTSIINQEASRSRSQDTDYEAALSNKAQLSIRRQAAQASLVQANASSQSVLSMMR